jgi:hypothetical protein
MTSVNSGDELTELSSGHRWQVTGESFKGGLLHYKLKCKQPGREDANLLLCESGLFMRFKQVVNSANTRPFSLRSFMGRLK